jgi:polar amino acid transport system permease protein
MSTGTADDARTDRGTRSLTVGQLLLYAGAVAFWGYLFVRWTYNWVVEPGVGVSSREPFFSPEPFYAVRDALNAVGGVASLVLDPVAGLFDFLGFGITALPQLAEGAWATILLTLVGMLLGLVIAVPLTVARVYGGRVLSGVALAYTELIRGTPLLAQLFVLQFGIKLSSSIRQLPLVGTGVVPEEAFFVATIGFVFNSAAYQSEYFRGAFQSVDEGQLTAARSVGLSKLDGIRYVVVPQALRYGIVKELFFRADAIGSETFAIVEVLTLAALFYLALVLTATRLTKAVERAVAIPGVGSDVEARSG